jgi:hypothetical protein
MLSGSAVVQIESALGAQPPARSRPIEECCGADNDGHTDKDVKPQHGDLLGQVTAKVARLNGQHRKERRLSDDHELNDATRRRHAENGVASFMINNDGARR